MANLNEDKSILTCVCPLAMQKACSASRYAASQPHHPERHLRRREEELPAGEAAGLVGGIIRNFVLLSSSK